MTVSPKTIRIAVALVISICFIVAGYFLSTPLRLTIANAGSTEALLKAYAAKDTDADGLPDWQESLYGTDVANAHSVDKTLTDKEAVDKGLVQPKFKSEAATSTPSTITENSFDGTDAPAPGSLTERFSRAFLQSYLSASGGQTLDKAAQQTIVDGLLKTFTVEASKEVNSSYTALSVHTSPGASVTEYVNAMYVVFGKEDLSDINTDVISYSEALLEKNDESARAKLKKLSGIYGRVATGLLTVSVPPQLTNDHLALVRSFDTMGNVTRLAAAYEEDPVAALGGFAAYQPSAVAITGALKNIASAILQNGEPAEKTPGASIVNFARSLETQ